MGPGMNIRVTNYRQHDLPPDEPLPDVEDLLSGVHLLPDTSRPLDQPPQNPQGNHGYSLSFAHRPTRYDTPSDSAAPLPMSLYDTPQHYRSISLLDLPLPLIDDLWPASRRIMGIKVCHTLRSCLPSTNKVTLISCDREFGDFSPSSSLRRDMGQVEGGHMATFSQFRAARIHLISRGTGRLMLHSLARAMDRHGGQVHSLTLSGNI